MIHTLNGRRAISDGPFDNVDFQMGPVRGASSEICLNLRLDGQLVGRAYRYLNTTENNSSIHLAYKLETSTGKCQSDSIQYLTEFV